MEIPTIVDDVEYLDTNEAAEVIGCNPSTLRRYRQDDDRRYEDELPCFKHGRTYLYSREDVERFADEAELWRYGESHIIVRAA